MSDEIRSTVEESATPEPPYRPTDAELCFYTALLVHAASEVVHQFSFGIIKPSAAAVLIGNQFKTDAADIKPERLELVVKMTGWLDPTKPATVAAFPEIKDL